MFKVNFYVCPKCGNVTMSTTDAEVRCCGRKLEPEYEGVSQGTRAEISGNEYVVSVGHPMQPDHYFSFLAAVGERGVQFVKLHPGQKAEARFIMDGVEKIYTYCTVHGLFAKTLK